MQYAKYLTLFLQHVKSSPSKKLKKIEWSQRTMPSNCLPCIHLGNSFRITLKHKRKILGIWLLGLYSG